MTNYGSNPTYVVKSGDCPWTIAENELGSGLRWTEIADASGLQYNASTGWCETIYPGDKLTIPGTTSDPKTTVDSSGNANKTTTSGKTVSISYFGLQAGTDRTLYAAWTWDKSNTLEYKVRWWYCVDEGVALIGTETTTTHKSISYTAPDNAKRAWIHVMPVSKKHTVNNKEVSYWTGSWSKAKTWYFSKNPPVKPSAPSVTMDNLKLTAELSNITDTNTKQIQFQVVKDNSKVYKTGTAKVSTQYAAFTCDVAVGGKYKVRCRGERDGLYGEWSEYTENFETIPSAPKEITSLKSTSSKSVRVEWSDVTTAKSFTVEYTTKKDYFDSSDAVSSITVNRGTDGVHHCEITSIESGEEYFFRVKASNDQGDSSWTAIKSLIVGKKPSAPTTWSSTTSAVVGESITLYWVHNSEDGSSQTYAELSLTVGNKTITETIKNSTDEDLKDKTSSYKITLSSLSSKLNTTLNEGAHIKWKVRTKGVVNEYGPWSVERTVDIYTKPTVSLNISATETGEDIEVVEKFPFWITASASPNTSNHKPIGYSINITAQNSYDTVDAVGNEVHVSKGDSVYTDFFDVTGSPFQIMMDPSDVDLENNKYYKVSCTVNMNSGLTATTSNWFHVSWDEPDYIPDAEITVDPETLAAHINPYCKKYKYVAYQVNRTIENGVSTYIKTNTKLSDVEGVMVRKATTTDGDQVYVTDGLVYFCLVLTETGWLVSDIKLSVYRREYDGRFVEIATGISNDLKTFTTDPHPSLDYARYRIVAVDNNTGAISYTDIPGYPVQEKAVIIQWDEKWSDFDPYGPDALEEPAWSGSMLKLPYNVDVSDKNEKDVKLVEYIGREHPVSYYGTQRGESATWNVEIDREDVETLYALRRLRIWMGDVYVREPSGSGYWANVKVSFSQKHCNLTVPVTLELTRVEGGV